MNQRWKQVLRLLRSGFYLVMDAVLALPFFLLALLSRLIPRPVDVGLGPDPLINNIYHKKALERQGYRVETFVHQVYFITDDFDVRADRLFPGPLLVLRNYYLFLWILFRYRCLYLYFNGGPLGFTSFLWTLEPLLYRVAGIRTVLMPYGGDLQEMSRSPNLLFKDAMSRDYPGHRFRRRRIAQRIDRWTCYADHIIAGCEWVDYLYHWDTLMLAHFSIDTDLVKPISTQKAIGQPLRILHAPNHRFVKGTAFFQQAVAELRAEGVTVELQIIERVPNVAVRAAIATADLIADQLIVGWYAMFALEAMAMGKPVLCFLRPDLVELYRMKSLMAPDEPPIVRCSPWDVKDTIRYWAAHQDELAALGQSSRRFVEKHHSLEAVGKVFAGINASLAILPGGRTGHNQKARTPGA